jgi:hypothetical protein
VSVFKNEGPYLAEWIEYHLLVGVDFFDLVLNDNADNSSEVLRPYIALGIVTLSNWPGLYQQKKAFTAHVHILRTYSCWVATIDADEYLVPREGRSIAKILRRFEGVPGVEINWVMFGTNGKLKWESGLVIERFRIHTSWDLPQNRHIKTIANPRMVVKCDCHRHEYVGGIYGVDVRGREAKEWFLDVPAVHETMWINHYWTKSVEEFHRKRLRKRNSRRVLSIDDYRNAPDVVANQTGVDWVIPLVKQNLAKRNR